MTQNNIYIPKDIATAGLSANAFILFMHLLGHAKKRVNSECDDVYNVQCYINANECMLDRSDTFDALNELQDAGRIQYTYLDEGDCYIGIEGHPLGETQ